MGLDKLPDFGVDTTVAEAVRMRPTNIKRVLIRARHSRVPSLPRCACADRVIPLGCVALRLLPRSR
jgi:hypothetical protein